MDGDEPPLVLKLLRRQRSQVGMEAEFTLDWAPRSKMWRRCASVGKCKGEKQTQMHNLSRPFSS